MGESVTTDSPVARLAGLGGAAASSHRWTFNPIARLSVELSGEFHPDPADRIVVATAAVHDARM